MYNDSILIEGVYMTEIEKLAKSQSGRAFYAVSAGGDRYEM